MLPPPLAPTLWFLIHLHSPLTCPRADAQLANQLGDSFSVFDPRQNGDESGVTLLSQVT
jgi:hypothetical protein